MQSSRTMPLTIGAGDVSYVGPGLVQYEEMHVHPGHTTVVRPGTILERIDVPPQNPMHADGGIMVDGRLVAMAGPSDAPITFRSQNPSGYRGHLMAMGEGSLQLVGSNVNVVDMGRTTISPISASNPIGRYAVHLHLCGDGGVNSRIEGINVYDTVSPSIWRFGIVVHGTNRATVRNNWVREKGGAGIYLEDGTETDNVIEGNLCEYIRSLDGLNSWTAGSHKPTERPVTDRGWEGSGIYLRGHKNFVRNNAAKHCAIGLETFAYQGPSQYEPINQLSDMLIEDCYTGFEPWYMGCDVVKGGQLIPVRQYIDRFTIRRCHVGIFHYYVGRATHRDFVIENCNTGVTANDYRLAECEYLRPHVSGSSFAGFYLGSFIDNGMLVEDGVFSGNAADVFSETPWSSGSAVTLPPRLTTWRRCQFGSATKIRMAGAGQGKKHYVISDRMRVEAFQGNANDNFWVYSNQQSPTTILPKTSADGSEIGSPVAGLTNQQNHDQYGVQWGGELLPANAAARTGIVGKVAA